MAIESDCSASAEWRANWQVVLASAVGMLMTSMHAHSMGVMLQPIEQDTGWSRATITSGLLIASVASVILTPISGMLVDRFGPRRIALVGMLCYTASIALLSTTGQEPIYWFLLWSIVALGSMNINPTVWLSAISSLFDRSRGLALAIALASTGLGQAGFPWITLMLQSNFEWRTAYAILGALSAIVVLPILLLCFRGAADQRGGEPAANRNPALLPGVTRRQGFASADFARLAFIGLAMSSIGGMFTLNLVPLLQSNGLQRTDAVALASVAGVGAILGRLGGGLLLDRFNARKVGAFFMLGPFVTAAILLNFAGNFWLAVVAVCFSGLAVGAEMDVVAYIAGRRFGLRYFGALFGTLMGLIVLGVALGPTLANAVYDALGSYEPVLKAVLPLALLVSIAFLTIGHYPEFGADASTGRTGGAPA